MMADLLEETVPADARSRNISANVSPAPKAPILRKPRRVTPSQNRCFSPQMVNMAGPPFKQPGRRKVIQGGLPKAGIQAALLMLIFLRPLGNPGFANSFDCPAYRTKSSGFCGLSQPSRPL